MQQRAVKIDREPILGDEPLHASVWGNAGNLVGNKSKRDFNIRNGTGIVATTAGQCEPPSKGGKESQQTKSSAICAR